MISDQMQDGFLPHILMATLSGVYTEYAEVNKAVVSNIKDIIMLMDGAASGKVAIGHNGVIGSTFAKLELENKKLWAVLYLFLLQKEPDIQANTTGTTIPHTDKGKVLDYDLIIPSDLILNYFSTMYENILGKTINNRNESVNLSNTRNLLLPKLLNGGVYNG